MDWQTEVQWCSPVLSLVLGLPLTLCPEPHLWTRHQRQYRNINSYVIIDSNIQTKVKKCSAVKFTQDAADSLGFCFFLDQPQCWLLLKRSIMGQRRYARSNVFIHLQTKREREKKELSSNLINLRNTLDTYSSFKVTCRSVVGHAFQLLHNVDVQQFKRQ